MIPPDVASRLQISAETTLRPVAQPQEIADKLSDLVPGQRIMAEIQSLLPNGTYRALINQRSVTLSLPFSAKAGDALEMFVTENDGKIALAVAERPAASESAAPTLSRAGQLIAQLLSGARQSGERLPPLTLNENRPLTASPSAGGQAFVPALKQAIVQSGMFYESHQAEWIEGRFAKAALLSEPQGKLSSPTAFAATFRETFLPEHAAGAPASAETSARAALARSPATLPDNAESHAEAHAPEARATLTGENSDAPASRAARLPAASSQQAVAPPAQFLVQQQLEALASQKFVWQGQIWPGQDMYWEIDDDEPHHDSGGAEDAAGRWSTRLRMDLPNLGAIDIGVLLQGNQISLSMRAARPETRDLMRSARNALQNQMDEAGLALASLGIESDVSTALAAEGDERVP
ncbi:MAG: flagellar hook-length control protein FliK [Candidatus Accumulibacter sp.]|jgi:hypothetical protein|nr:flagellar hook-length control protein FliK [Accumulibacter sp.]